MNYRYCEYISDQGRIREEGMQQVHEQKSNGRRNVTGKVQ